MNQADRCLQHMVLSVLIYDMATQHPQWGSCAKKYQPVEEKNDRVSSCRENLVNGDSTGT